MRCGDCGEVITAGESWTTSRHTEKPQHWKCPPVNGAGEQQGEAEHE